jgi:hypothetical protein
METKNNYKSHLHWQHVALAFGSMFFIVWIYSTGTQMPTIETASIEELVLPEQGVVLPITWGNLGKKLIETGVIDVDKFESLYKQRGELTEEQKALLYSTYDEAVVINTENAGFLLNMLWGFGLANKNQILDEGPMQDSQYGGAGNFASTGGWSLAIGDAMEHYSAYAFILLTDEQQALVESVSKNIYRPCCGNSTYFPDCNHGIAMLGLLELMAANGANEKEMYDVALQVNSYWFPSTYLTLATYFDERGLFWDDVDAKDVLGAAYSSSQGFQQVLAEINPVQSKGGGSCGV